MNSRQEKTSWLELLLIMLTIMIAALFLIYLFTGKMPGELPEFLVDAVIDGRMKEVAKEDFGKLIQIRLYSKSGSGPVLGLSILSGGAFLKSLIN